MIKLKLKKIFILISLLIISSLIFSPIPVFSQTPASFPNSIIHPQPVLKWGNTSYHDGTGARDPWVVKDSGTYYLYYDCTENLLNPSFESNLQTNGWDVWHATVSSSTEQKLFGQNSLKVVTDGTANAGAYTGNYYYLSNPISANLASPTGIAVFPGETYIASAYVWASPNTSVGFMIQQYLGDPKQWAQNRLDDQYSQTLQGNGSWQRVSVKFTADIKANVVTLSLFSPSSVSTTSYWDGVQLERVTPSINTPSDFPGDKEWFNRPLEEIVGWRACVASSSDGINFTKHGPIKVEGTKGAWEDLEKPGWYGSSFSYINPFPYLGKWYAYYWKGGGPLDSQEALTYARLRTGLPSGLNSLNSPDRSGLAIADSPLGPFRRISQSGPVLEVEDPSGLCNLEIRPDQAAQGKVLGCDYLTTIGVPHLINNQWIMYYAAQTTRQKGVFGGTQGNGTCMVNGITASFATSSNPLGPWIPSDQSPIFNPSEVCFGNGGPGALEGPVYYKDRSGKNVLFLNGISGGGHSIQAIWTDNPLAKWSLQNRKIVISKEQTPGGAGSAINLPSVIESDDGQNLNLYFGYRQGVPAGAQEADMHAFIFHDIGLLTLPLPLFSTTPPPPTTPASLVGYSIAESRADLPIDSSSARVIKTTNPRISLTHNFPESDTEIIYTIFVKFFYSNDSSIISQQSIKYNPLTATQSPPPQNSSIVYVDGSLAEDCPNKYSLASRNCSGQGGTTAYKKVNTALGQAKAGSTILVRQGEYREYRSFDTNTGISFYINLPITLKSYNNEAVTLTYDPAHPPKSSSASYNPIIQIYTPEGGAVVIDGFTIIGTKNLQHQGDHSGEINIDISSGGNITIQNNNILEAGHSGVKLGNLNGSLTVQYNHFVSNGYDFKDHGIYSLAEDTNPKVIRYNSFYDNTGYGIHIYSESGHTANHEVYGNVVFNNKEGGIVITGNNQKIINNTFYNNGAGGGIRLFHYGLNNITVKNNISWNHNNDFTCETQTGAVTGEIGNNIWKSSYFSEKSPGDCDLLRNSIHKEDDPKFISSSPVTWSDFGLLADSPAKDYGLSLGYQILSPEGYILLDLINQDLIVGAVGVTSKSGAVTPIGYTISEDLIELQNTTTPQNFLKIFPTTINYSLTTTGVKNIYVKFFYSNGTSVIKNRALNYKVQSSCPDVCYSDDLRTNVGNDSSGNCNASVISTSHLCAQDKIGATQNCGGTEYICVDRGQAGGGRFWTSTGPTTSGRSSNSSQTTGDHCNDKTLYCNDGVSNCGSWSNQANSCGTQTCYYTTFTGKYCGKDYTNDVSLNCQQPAKVNSKDCPVTTPVVGPTVNNSCGISSTPAGLNCNSGYSCDSWSNSANSCGCRRCKYETFTGTYQGRSYTNDSSINCQQPVVVESSSC